MKVFHDESNIFVYLNFRLKCYILQKELNKISYVFVFSRFMKDFTGKSGSIILFATVYEMFYKRLVLQDE